MLNAGNDQYNHISIPDDKLLAAIGSGIHRDRIRRRKKALRSFTAAAAGYILLLFTCANIPVLYTYASEIPIMKTFVQAMRIGSGGRQMSDVTISIGTDLNSASVSFLSESEITEHVLSYSAEYHYGPSRLQMTFSGMSEEMFLALKDKMIPMKAVRDIYQVQSLQDDEITFVIALDSLYNYELMEFSNPGSLTISFYQDAYYTEEEMHPGEKIYFIRTEALDFETKLKDMLKKYEAEKPTQIKNMQGAYLLVIGEYETKSQAEAELDQLVEKYGSDTALAIDEIEVEKTPES